MGYEILHPYKKGKRNRSEKRLDRKSNPLLVAISIFDVIKINFQVKAYRQK